jgi:hypothetical protein
MYGKRIIGMVTALVFLQLVDWWLTVKSIEVGGIELNPLMAPVFTESIWQALAVKLIIPIAAGVMLYVWGRDRQWVYAWLWIAVWAYIAVVLWNFGQLV